jgi:hypothetical protein
VRQQRHRLVADFGRDGPVSASRLPTEQMGITLEEMHDRPDCLWPEILDKSMTAAVPVLRRRPLEELTQSVLDSLAYGDE